MFGGSEPEISISTLLAPGDFLTMTYIEDRSSALNLGLDELLSDLCNLFEALH